MMHWIRLLKSQAAILVENWPVLGIVGSTGIV